MLMNLYLVNMSMLDIFFRVDAVTVISLILRINFAKIHIDSEVFVSMTLLFCKMFSLVKIFH